MFYDAKSGIHGHGCFAQVSIPEGVDTWCATYPADCDSYSTIVNSEDESRELHSPFRFINHSETPNAELYEDEGGEFYLTFLRDVAPDDEITIDYGEDYDFTQGD